jgi:hypothetical protein
MFVCMFRLPHLMVSGEISYLEDYINSFRLNIISVSTNPL